MICSYSHTLYLDFVSDVPCVSGYFFDTTTDIVGSETGVDNVEVEVRDLSQLRSDLIESSSGGNKPRNPK